MFTKPENKSSNGAHLDTTNNLTISIGHCSGSALSTTRWSTRLWDERNNLKAPYICSCLFICEASKTIDKRILFSFSMLTQPLNMIRQCITAKLTT